MTVPEFMPILSAGCHESPKDGACVMEYASFLAEERWSDKPACVHPNLAFMARSVNDRLPDDERQALLALLPRLMGTTSDVVVKVRASGSAPCSCRCGAQFERITLSDLTDALDEYDRLTGRTAPAPLAPSDLARLAALTSA